MTQRWTVTLWVGFALGCGGSKAAATPAADVSRLLLENDKVRVSEVTIAPGQRIAAHPHPDFVMYALSGGELTGTAEGGTPEKLALAAGEAAFSPAVTHAVENTGTTEVKLVVVEMRQPSARAPAGEDPMKVAPAMHRLVLDHERVRVTEVTFAPRQTLPNHVHPDHVVYLLTDANVALIGAEGSPRKVLVEKAGKALFVPATHHSNDNLADDPLKVVIFEIQ